MLIRNASLLDGRACDVRIEAGRISALGAGLPPRRGEALIDAGGGLLLPGLHDHHLHLRALAAAQASLACGPPAVTDADSLRAALRAADAVLPAGKWLRGTGYHASVAGEIDRDWLDRVLPDRPVRIQQRSGRQWILNSAALAALGLRDGDGQDDPCERVNGRRNGRLFEADAWLRSRLGDQPPGLAAVSRRLAAWGVTGVTDTSPGNGLAEYRAFAAAQQRGELLQNLLVMGNAELDALPAAAGDAVIARGALKLHLHESALPGFDVCCADLRRSHAAGRAVAFHCVTRAELVFALGVLGEAGSLPGDRIEHAAVTPPEQLAEMARLRLTVVTQPGFVAERGDVYLREVAKEDQPWLYRLRGFADAGVALAGSTDAPFTDANPWAAMQAAVARRTPQGQVIGAGESLSPEQALGLFLSPLQAPDGAARQVVAGAPADLCLLRENWAGLRPELSRARVRLTLRAGEPIFEAID